MPSAGVVVHGSSVYAHRTTTRHWEDSMTLPRRTFLQLTAGAMALPAASGLAWAQTPVRIMVGFAPGSSPDIVARLLAQSLSERLGQHVAIENMAGVGGNLATEAVVNAEPDGRTLLLVGPSSAIDATLYEKLDFTFLRDIAPVAGLVRSPNVMLVNPALPASTVSELIALAKTREITMASAGVGTAAHLAGEQFRMMTGIHMVHVPYRGGAGAYADLVRGAVDVYVPSLASAMDHLKAGSVRALAVTSASRVAQLPNIPAVAESVPGYEAGSWFGIGAPRGTPAAIVEQLNAEINASLDDCSVKARVAALGATAFAGSPADFGTLIADETRTWAKVVKV
jgi:tripartite-type tricarboxylate transporter receptor subunit TctC